MKAIVYRNYGSVDALRLEDVAKPTPKANQVLVRVRAAAANAADWYFLRGKPMLVRLSAGLLKPNHTILGSDIAGHVEAVGKEANLFQPGDAVFGDLSGCGMGGFAEYVCAPEHVLAPKPASLTFEAAAAVPMAAVTALQGLRDFAGVRQGQQVLIHGASGGVGTWAVQLAKHFGAEVTAVCSTGKIDLMRSLGADHVIDYTREDFARQPQRYDLIVGINGHLPLSTYKRALAPAGVYVCIGGTMAQIFESLLLGSLMSMNTRQKLISMGSAQPSRRDLLVLGELLESGRIAPVIDRRYPLSDVPEALGYLGQGHAKGKIVITLEGATDH